MDATAQVVDFEKDELRKENAKLRDDLKRIQSRCLVLGEFLGERSRERQIEIIRQGFGEEAVKEYMKVLCPA